MSHCKTDRLLGQKCHTISYDFCLIQRVSKQQPPIVSNKTLYWENVVIYEVFIFSSSNNIVHELAV